MSSLEAGTLDPGPPISSDNNFSPTAGVREKTRLLMTSQEGPWTCAVVRGCRVSLSTPVTQELRLEKEGTR